MLKAGKRLIEAAQEAVAIAKGEQPAAAIYHNGHKYVPAAELEAAEVELASIRGVLGNLLPLIYLENERGIGWRIASEDEDGHTWDGDMLRAAQVALRALRTLEKNV